MEMKPRTPEFDKLAFTVLAIEVSAEELGVTATEMRRRLERTGLMKDLIGIATTLCIPKAGKPAEDVVEGIVKP